MMQKVFVLTTALVLISVSSPAQDFAKQRLEKSPRHQEWVTVKNGERVVHSFLVFPEVKDKATAVVVIHGCRAKSDLVTKMFLT